MTTAIIIVVLVVLALAAVGLVLTARRRREREQLRERFGPEYDRAVEEHGDRREAEHRLANAATRRDKAEIRELTTDERMSYLQRWTDVQAAFVDDPAAAARDADELVVRVMRDRGYPLDDVDDVGDLVAADHAELAGHYRDAHATGRRAHEATTEELRQAFVHYRALFVQLLDEPRDRHEPAAADQHRIDLTTTDAPGPERSRPAPPV